MRITILTYVEAEDAVKYDAAVEQVAAALRKIGHQVSILGIHDDVRTLLSGIARRRPDLIFNLVEEFGSGLFGDIAIAGVLESLGIPFTGGGPGELYLQRDKVLTKKILAFDSIPFPRYAVFAHEHGDLETGGNLRMPTFVKPLASDASIGIDKGSLVHSSNELMERVLSIHKKCHDSALAEEYIEGREFYVGVLGNHQPLALPPIEMDFSGLPSGMPRILDRKAKWVKSSEEYRGTRAVLAELKDELRARLQKVSLDAYRALRVRDYGRIDLRLSEAGEVYVIEVNASCYLEQSSEFVAAASACGLDYPQLLQRIVELALERQGRGRRPAALARPAGYDANPAADSQ